MEFKKYSRGIIETTYIEETIPIVPSFYFSEGEGKARILLGKSDKNQLFLGLMREPTEVVKNISQGNFQEEDPGIKPIRVPKVLSFQLNYEIPSKEEFLETIDRGLMVY